MSQLTLKELVKQITWQIEQDLNYGDVTSDYVFIKQSKGGYVYVFDEEDDQPNGDRLTSFDSEPYFCVGNYELTSDFETAVIKLKIGRTYTVSIID